MTSRLRWAWTAVFAAAGLAAAAGAVGAVGADDITLTQDQLRRLLKVVEERGSRALIPGQVSGLLGLEARQIGPDVKQVVYQDPEGNKHGFAPLNDGSGYFMFRNGAALGHSVYRVDGQLHLVRAARALRSIGPLIGLPAAQAQQELSDEFARWSKVLSPAGPAPMPFPFKPPQQPDPSASAH